MSENLKVYKTEVEQELRSILDFWKSRSIDIAQGGFVGRLDYLGAVHPEAEKGCVLNARILWSFAAAYNHGGDPVCYLLAERAYHYMQNYFRDWTHGGVYWSVDAAGAPLNRRKQIYGLAFTIYGLAEYYRINQEQEVLDFAIDLYNLIEKYSFDRTYGGYLEAFSENWQLLDDLRLSEKDRNDPKTMNTHLHIIEAYVNLYRVWPDAGLHKQIRHLLDVFEQRIIDPETYHMRLFFDNEWRPQSQAISYGHDIEAAWLLQESAEVLHDEALTQKWKQVAVKMADAAAEGLNPDGSLHHEYDPATDHYDTHREWWVTAEGMVGYLNAYQNTGDTRYLDLSLRLWEFAKQYLIDHERGEWIWGVYGDYRPMPEDKVGFWKCPYHNSRACLEVSRRLKFLISKNVNAF
ncbi:AGE family epimerase/isomerase [Telluribacter sp. SYSU D00476]|uniref:AGE family epimerase/isomerase n=1 Tax=Telluribacter sp. SYSU D00476 TaxID=2811430 RepID=UPI001FF5AFD7|nr:AGE family epimerase/isomerase [Telluribacter sp. SYSU D00476]